MSFRRLAEWHTLLAALRKPGDSVFVDISRARAHEVLLECGPAVSQYVRAHMEKGGMRFVRLRGPKNVTQQLANLKVGEELTMPASSEATVASLATRVRHAYPTRRYLTRRDRDARTFSVKRTK